MIIFILSICLHELGHLLCGLMCGYEFVFIKLLFVMIEKKCGRLSVRLVADGALGQCIMTHKDIYANGYALIVGGCAANLLCSVSCFVLLGIILNRKYLQLYEMAVVLTELAAGFSMLDLWNICVYICLLYAGALNLYFAVSNMYAWGGRKNDGATLCEVMRGKEYMKMYNFLMQTAAQVSRGASFRDIEGMETEMPDDCDSSLLAEISLYEMYRLVDTGISYGLIYTDDFCAKLQAAAGRLASFTDKCGFRDEIERELDICELLCTGRGETDGKPQMYESESEDKFKMSENEEWHRRRNRKHILKPRDSRAALRRCLQDRFSCRKIDGALLAHIEKMTQRSVYRGEWICVRDVAMVLEESK